MERWRQLLVDGRPHAGKPLPDCLGDWTGQHDMAECGQRIQGGGRHETVDTLCQCAGGRPREQPAWHAAGAIM